MKIQSIFSLLLLGLLLVLVSCDETPTGFDPTGASLDRADASPSVSLNAPDRSAARAQEALIRVPRQVVDASRNARSTKARVASRIRLFTDGRARGAFRVRTREDGLLVLRALMGRGVFDASGDLVWIVIQFRQADGQRFTATVTPGSDPDCDLWDLLGSGVQSGQVAISFEARTQIRVRDAVR
jgi:hypothetical protein